MIPEDHQRLTECWRGALDLIIHGLPHKTDGSFEIWHQGAQMTLTTFKELLAKYAPYQTFKSTADHDPSRGTDRGGVVGADEVPGANGL